MSKPETLDLTRNTKPASDAEIEIAADDIMAILKCFDSPKDAGAALTLAHYKMIAASFPPAFRKDAIDTVRAEADLVISMLDEGWQ